MAYFYHFELILAGIILLSAMGYVGVRLWIKKRREEALEKENQDFENKNADIDSVK